jgi:hypothetical protein
MKHGVPHGSILEPPFFITHINDLPLRINSVSDPILFADDTSVIITSRNFEDFCSVSNSVLSHMIKWFADNNLVLSIDKTNIIKSITKNSAHSTLHTSYREMYIEETVNTKFLVLQTDNHINLKNHIEEIIANLSTVYHAIRSMVRISNINTLRSIYYAYFNSSTKYGIILRCTLNQSSRWNNLAG